MPRSRHPKKAKEEVIEASKKIKFLEEEKKQLFPNKKIRLMFQDEAGFGRVNKPKRCWSKKGDSSLRPLSSYQSVSQRLEQSNPGRASGGIHILIKLDGMNGLASFSLLSIVHSGMNYHIGNALFIIMNGGGKVRNQSFDLLLSMQLSRHVSDLLES